jgi:hypothetical protein
VARRLLLRRVQLRQVHHGPCTLRIRTCGVNGSKLQS